MTLKQSITHELNDNGAWICVCKNTPSGDGFFPCDDMGNEVEPLVGSNWNDKYICASCGRIINQYTLEITGRNKKFVRI